MSNSIDASGDGDHLPADPQKGWDWIASVREQWDHDRAMQMAAALSFRTLFGLLPVMVVATVLVKALGMEEYYLGPLGKLFSFLGLNHVSIIPPADSGLARATTLDVWLQDRVRDAGQINVAAIGWVGVSLTLYAAISLMVTIENCCNIIYRAPHGRAWTNRVPIYWFVLTISPLMVIFSTFIDSRFQSTMVDLHLFGWLTSLAGTAWTLFALWVLMLSAYMLFPNTRVHPKPAMIGALVSAVLLATGKRTMGAYLENAMSLSQLYGSLGLVPLFMFWVYVMWLAVLFGLEVSALLQRNVAHWRFEPHGETHMLPFDAATLTAMLKRLSGTPKPPERAAIGVVSPDAEHGFADASSGSDDEASTIPWERGKELATAARTERPRENATFNLLRHLHHERGEPDRFRS